MISPLPLMNETNTWRRENGNPVWKGFCGMIIAIESAVLCLLFTLIHILFRGQTHP